MNATLAKRVSGAGIVVTIALAALAGFQPEATSTALLICIVLGFVYGILMGIEATAEMA